jgi:hypothetical protein
LHADGEDRIGSAVRREGQSSSRANLVRGGRPQ